MKHIFKKVLLSSFGGMLCLGLSGCFNNNQSKAGNINFRNQIDTVDAEYTKVNSREFNHFNIEKQVPHYELESLKLSRIFIHNFHHYSTFSSPKYNKFYSPITFRLHSSNSPISFTGTDDEANPNNYHAIVPSLHSTLGKHTITFTDGKRNVTYLLYELKQENDDHLGSHELILIPIQEKINGNHETKISRKQGRHYLVHIKEIEKLAPKSAYPKYRGNLPKD